MFNNDRQQKIINYLKTHASATVDELSENVYASPSTIRRDLNELERCGFVSRFHGGAVVNTNKREGIFSHFREANQSDEKNKIADFAERFIKSSTSYFFDASTTCIPLGFKLKKYQDVRIATNGLRLTAGFTDEDKVAVTCTGGNYNKNYEDFSGAVTLNAIKMMHADVYFFSCAGMSLDVGTADRRDSTYKRAFLENSDTHILLCDSTKFDKHFFYKCFDLSEIDYVVTDRKPDNPAYEEYFGDRLIFS